MRATPALRSCAFLLCSVALAPRGLAQRDSAFMEEFRKLMAIHDVEGMVTSIKKHEPEAILAVIEICEAIGQGSNDILEEEIDALGKAWRKGYDSRFVEMQYNYFSVDLSGPYKKHRRELIDRYLKKRVEFDAAEKAKDLNKLPALGLEFNGFGDALAELGDHYMAAQCYRTYAVCFDDGLNGSKADYRLACEGWGLFLQARERIELKDKTYNDAKVRFEKLEFDGYGDPSKGPDARAAEKAVSDSSYAPVPLKAAFELVPDIEAVQRPMFMADTNFQIWAAITLGKVDSTAVIPTMEKSPTVLRTGASKAAVDVDGDGKGDVDIPLTGKITPVQISLIEGETRREWAFLAAIGQQRDTYQNINPWNLGPDDDHLDIHIAAAGSLVGAVDGIRVQVIDENLDGLYGGPTKEWAYVGLVEGAYQKDVDTVVIGESKVARPWSKLQKIGPLWYKLEPDGNGTDIIATRTDVETGTLQLELKGLPVSWLIVRGTGNNQDLYYDVVDGGTNKVEVPIGSYELFVGQVASGKKAQMMKALVLPGANSRSWSVRTGETTKMELGAPFGFSFKVEQDENTVKVDGNSIVVVGRGNETYQRLWNCVLAPELNLRKAGQSKGKKEAKLSPIESQEQLQDHNNDFRVAWFPVAEPVEKPSPGDTYEVQLFEKKHKLFGKVEAEWRGN